MFKNLKDLINTREKLEIANIELSRMEESLIKIRKIFDRDVVVYDTVTANKIAYLKNLNDKIKVKKRELKLMSEPVKKTATKKLTKTKK